MGLDGVERIRPLVRVVAALVAVHDTVTAERAVVLAAGGVDLQRLQADAVEEDIRVQHCRRQCGVELEIHGLADVRAHIDHDLAEAAGGAELRVGHQDRVDRRAVDKDVEEVGVHA